MRYRKLGRSGLIVSEMCLGTNMFGGAGDKFWEQYGALDQDTVNGVVGTAVEGGVNFFDTADGYTKGESEQRLGQAIRDLGLDRSSVYICTKGGTQSGTGPNGMGGSRAHILDACDKSLKRLGTDYIDVYLLHWFDPATPIDETLRAFDDLVRWGKVRYVGCSNFYAWEAMKAIGVSERERLARFDVVQNLWSIATREIERELVPFCRSEGVGLMAFGVLLAGVLTGKYRRDGSSDQPGRFGGEVPALLDRERVHDIIDTMREIASAHDVTPAEIAIAFLLREKALSAVIVGATKAEQVAANLRASDITLSEEEFKRLDEASGLPVDYGPTRTAPARTARQQFL
jgi:aryl-alcohol dehydrogenase-like predicted oxidoreductase